MNTIWVVVHNTFYAATVFVQQFNFCLLYTHFFRTQLQAANSYFDDPFQGRVLIQGFSD